MKNTIRVIIPEGVYFGGDIVYGVAELNVTKKLQSRGIKLLFAAYEYTRWTERRGKYSHTHWERRVFLTHRIDFTPKTEKAETVIPGLYRWPFAIVLPKFIPPSCRLTFGRIEYNFCVYVDIPLAFDLKHTKSITVGGNLYDQIHYCLSVPPIVKSSIKKFMLVSGEINMQVTIPKYNFFIGEVVSIGVTGNNNSNKSIDSIKISFLINERFMAHGSRTFAYDRKYKQKYNCKYPAKSGNFTTMLQYNIPNEVPTFSTEIQASPVHPKIIQLIHFIRVGLDLPWATDLKLDFPINIMHVNPRAPMITSTPYALPPLPVTFSLPLAQNNNNFNNTNIHNNNLSSPYPLPSPSIAPTSPMPDSYSPATSPYPNNNNNNNNDPSVSPSLSPTNLNNNSQNYPPNYVNPFLPVPAAPPSAPPLSPPLALSHSRDSLSSSIPNYPILDNYEFPRNTQAILLDFGEHQVNDDEMSLLEQ